MHAIEFDPWLEAAVGEVLESMCFLSTVGDADSDAQKDCAPDWISTRLSFQGICCGSFGVRAPLATALQIAANFLGEEEDTLTDAQTAEVMCELANMVCGALLARVESKHAFALSSPKRDTCPTDAPLEADRIARTLGLDEGILHVWLEMKTCP